MSATRYTCVANGGNWLVTTYAGDIPIGEMGVCRQNDCRCEGSWVNWGVGLSSHDLDTLPHEGPNPLTGA